MTVQTAPLAIPAKSESRLLALSKQLGVPARTLLIVAIEDFYNKYQKPITEIPGVDPADVLEAAAQLNAGEVFTHDEVFAQLRNRT